MNGAILIRKYKAARDIFSQLYDECINHGVQVGNKINLTPDQVENHVSEATGVPVDIMKSNRRHKYPVEARMIAYHIMYNWLGMTLEAIGKRFGGRDHTTVLHALQSFDDWIFTDKAFALKAKRVEDDLLNKSVEHD